ncbi:MarR family winged helix-turn-helix transcriptional regulator [Sinomonas sp. JGH33]|uniref:MarR family winged helix-turn-helix transcriptional regulator n=1 Tax=Sinomonas terricola TaxID=3110330 RepID=A0ABU5TAQ1_9MICC|nr:MarR family winged helix-turn-helix transcriptional regulator [Sinomonas sp. JGH33]MEA5456612.1 MarR family winged helix-turn-helix transcriptional regulator [Sinomonas sp. JGH33]
MTATERGGAHVPSVRETAEAWESLFRAQVAVMRRLQSDPAFRELGIKEYDVLFTLTQCPEGGLRLNELNDHVLLAQSSLSRLVERLERKGLVTRRSAPDDGRGTLIALTEAGWETQRRIGRAHVREIARLLGGALDGGELAELTQLTARLRDHVVEHHPL